MLAFSTNWNASKHTEGEAIVAEILDLGFTKLEIGHGLSVSQLQGIRKAFEGGGFEVVSVHNFCPMPVEIQVDNPDCYEFTSKVATQRDRAIRLTKQTMETAKEFGARHIVLHLGRVTPVRGMTDDLMKSLLSVGVASKKHARAKLEAVRRRESFSHAYLERIQALLEPLVELAEQADLILVAENRSDYEAFPTEREMLHLMRHFGSSHFRYWHDFGHAQMRESLGLLDHEQWLKEIAPFVAGAHLQDAKWPDEDHLVPFEGEVPFDRLLPLFPPGIPFVLELSRNASPEAIRRCVGRWNELLSQQTVS